MLKNYLKVAIRNLIKQRVYSIINILGLAVGISGCLLIVFFVVDELSYDRFHTNADRIYKVALERKYPQHSTYYAIIPHSYADAMGRDFPEVEAVVRMGGPFNDVLVRYKDDRGDEKQFEEDFIMSADSSFFNVFSIKLLKGEANTVFKNLTDIVVTEATAKRYFGNEEPLGKVLTFFNQEFKVTGVCENVPENSHIKFDFLSKWSDQFFGGGNESNFITFTAHVYLLLKPGTDAAQLEAKFPKMVDTYASAQIERDLGKSWEDYKREGNGYRYFLQALPSIHLDPTHLEAKMKPGGNQNYVYFLICVAVLIVMIACINFMNLATARSAERAKEVGVRKTMGSGKTQLMMQFLVESIVICLVATLIAIFIVEFSLPFFNNLANKQLVFNFSPPLLSGLLAFAIVVGLLAGSYPAFALSTFNPVAVMKGAFSGKSKGAWLRNGLVVFQFWISIVLMVATLVVSDQMKFMQSKSLGFDKDQMLVVERVFALQNKAQTFVEELKRVPGVQSAASSFALLGREGDYFGAQFLPEGSSEILTTKTMVINDEMAETVGFEMVAGRGFSRETNDSLSLLLNETAVKTLGLAGNPVGQRLTLVDRNPNGNGNVVLTITGVVRDFNFQSLRDQITPLAIRNNESFGGGAVYAYAKVSSSDLQAVVQEAEAKWNQISDGQPFKYRFLDESLKANYEAEQRAGTLFSIFSGLAILIACVGLFGLAAYTASLRTKEIGVRKVLGASVMGVVLLLSKDFTKLILIAFALAVPLGWYVMNSWLASFAYRTQIGVGTFLIAGGVALVISWTTVSYQSIKAAIKNPVNSLRSE
ncbi:MAG: ABC transporter permease [Bacteroidota bacterium]